MRRPLIAALLILALGAAAGARAQLPATPKLPSFGKGLFTNKSSTKSAAAKPDAEGAVAAGEAPLRAPTSTLAGREATLQALQDCYAREAPRVRTSGAPDSRARRLRQLCENEEIADSRAWLKWSKIGSGRSPQRILNALREDDAARALTADPAAIAEKP